MSKIIFTEGVLGKNASYDWSNFTSEVGLTIDELTRIDLMSLETIPMKNAVLTEKDKELLLELQSNPSFMKTHGILVKGTPWNPDYRDKDGNPDHTIRVFYSHEEYDRIEAELVAKVQQESGEQGITYDAVIALPRGGINIGKKLAEGLNTPLGFTHIQSYGHGEKAGNIELGEIVLLKKLEEKIRLYREDPVKNKQPRVLIADDLDETGNSLLHAIRQFEAMGCLVDTTVGFNKKCSKATPTYCNLRKFPVIWICQPTEAWLDGITKDHNVGNIDVHPNNKLTKEIISIVRGRLQSLGVILKSVQFIVDKMDMHSGVMAAASRSVPKDKLLPFRTELQRDFARSEYYELPSDSGCYITVGVTGGKITVILLKKPLSPYDKMQCGIALSTIDYELLNKEVPITIAMHGDGTFGYVRGHETKNLCPDEDDEVRGNQQGLMQTKQGGESTYYQCRAKHSEISELDLLSTAYLTNLVSKARYDAICNNIIKRLRFSYASSF